MYSQAQLIVVYSQDTFAYINKHRSNVTGYHPPPLVRYRYVHKMNPVSKLLLAGVIDHPARRQDLGDILTLAR